ncbi:MAG: hypothetical protein IAE89_03930 [Anaerolineae bacterium]|nr:hypothetical protein [Anaerolineae bacterium]
MEKIKMRFDPTDNSLMIWFDDPRQMAYLSPIEEKSSGDLHFIKNEADEIMGIECQFYQYSPGSISVELETTPILTSLVQAD